MLIEFQPDIDKGKAVSVLATLTDADTVYTYVIPEWADGFSLYPSSILRYAIGEDPPAIEATKAGNAVAADYGVGNYVMANEWMHRALPHRAGNISGMTLRLLCDAAAKTCYIMFWGG